MLNSTPPNCGERYTRRPHMIMIALALGVLALLGFISSYTIGWLAHTLLIVAISLALARAIHGRTAAA